MTYYYSAYNLAVQSALQLSALPEIFSPGEPDITISYGLVSKEGLVCPTHKGFTYQKNETAFWLNIPSIARFLVSNGDHIIIDPIEDIDEDSVQVFLFGPCMEALLRQRQITILPGYALQMGDNGIAFAGNTGLGYSLLQGLWYKRGYCFSGGNFIALNHHGEVLPGTAQLEFWPAVIENLKLERNIKKTIRPNSKKQVIFLDKNCFQHPVPLKILYIMKTHHHPEVLFTPCSSEQKYAQMQQLLAGNNSPPFNNFMSKSNIPIVIIHLPKAGLTLQQLAECMENDISERGHSHVHS